MNRTCENSSSLWKRSGLTLIEVVASTALLATLLVSILIAYGRHARQIQVSRQRMAAVRATDRLLRDWFRSSEPLPRDKEGAFSDADGLRWRTRTRSDRHLDEIGAIVLIVDVFDASRFDQREPVTSVEILVEDREWKTKDETQLAR